MPNRMPLAEVRERLTRLAHIESLPFNDQRDACEIAAQAVTLVERLEAFNPAGPDGEGWQHCVFCGTNAEAKTPEHAADCLWQQARALSGEEERLKAKYEQGGGRGGPR